MIALVRSSEHRIDRDVDRIAMPGNVYIGHTRATLPPK
jgi:hypothetical protein